MTIAEKTFLMYESDIFSKSRKKWSIEWLEILMLTLLLFEMIVKILEYSIYSAGNIGIAEIHIFCYDADHRLTTK